MDWVLCICVPPAQLLVEELAAFSWPFVCRHLPAQLWPVPKTERSLKMKKEKKNTKNKENWLFLNFILSTDAKSATITNKDVAHVPRSQRWAVWSFCRYKMEPLQRAQPSSRPPWMSPKSYRASWESSWNLWNLGSTKKTAEHAGTCLRRH